MHPISDTYLDVQTAKASAALPAAGAWDTPTAMLCPGFDAMTLAVTYTRGGAAGAVDLAIQVSAYSLAGLVPAGQSEWVEAAIYGLGAVVAGADTQNLTQVEYVTFTATGAGAETFVLGPVAIAGIERIRVAARESGNVGAPGTLGMLARFS